MRLRRQHTVCVDGSFQVVSNIHAKELVAFHPLHCAPVNVDGGVLSLLFLLFFDVEGEVILLAPLH
jgi:hypothetical protein